MATRHLQEKFDYRGVTVIPLLTHKTWQEPNGFGVPIQFFDIVEKGEDYDESLRESIAHLGDFALRVTRPTRAMCMKKVDEWLEDQSMRDFDE